MRRSDREVTGLANILAILDKCDAMRIGLCDDNKPYIVPMNFAYETANGEVFIYLHCASKGRKLDIIAKNNNVCFETDCSYKTLKAEKACDWSAEYQSVIGEGNIAVLADEVQKISALNLLMKRHGFEGTPDYSQRDLVAVTVLRITVREITGKSKGYSA